jgi:hypothetical protein
MSVTSDEEVVYSPSKLGEYTVVQEIGEGTFGKVKSKQSVDPATSPSLTPQIFRGRPHHHRP